MQNCSLRARILNPIFLLSLSLFPSARARDTHSSGPKKGTCRPEKREKLRTPLLVYTFVRTRERKREGARYTCTHRGRAIYIVVYTRTRENWDRARVHCAGASGDGGERVREAAAATRALRQCQCDSPRETPRVSSFAREITSLSLSLHSIYLIILSSVCVVVHDL